MNVPTQPRVLDGEFLHAREQDVVDPPLALEVIAAVLEQPSQHRHQHALLDEDEEGGDAGGAVGFLPHCRLQSPCVAIAEELGLKQGLRIGCRRGRLQNAFDVGEKRWIVKLSRGAVTEQTFAEPAAHSLVQLRHHRVD